MGAISVGIFGCDALNTPPKTATKQAQVVAKEKRVSVRRFALTKFAGDVAFDTQTGQTCRT